MDYLYYLFVVLAFLAVVLFFEGMYLAWNAYKGPEAKRIEKRLQAMSAGVSHQNSLIKQRLLAQTPAVERLLLQIPRIHQLDRIITVRFKFECGWIHRFDTAGHRRWRGCCVADWFACVCGAGDWCCLCPCPGVLSPWCQAQANYYY
jgi:hypothetical protein